MFRKAFRNPEQIRGFLNSVATEPTAFAEHKLSGMGENNTVILSFAECACTDGQFNRLLNNRRAEIEAQILADVVKRLPDKNHPIKILSFGSGSLANEFVLLGLLVKAGYNNIEFAFVDTGYWNKEEYEKKIVMRKLKVLCMNFTNLLLP
jgi:hypothetical protein